MLLYLCSRRRCEHDDMHSPRCALLQLPAKASVFACTSTGRAVADAIRGKRAPRKISERPLEADPLACMRWKSWQGGPGPYALLSCTDRSLQLLPGSATSSHVVELSRQRTHLSCSKHDDKLFTTPQRSETEASSGARQLRPAPVPAMVHTTQIFDSIRPSWSLR